MKKIKFKIATGYFGSMRVKDEVDGYQHSEAFAIRNEDGLWQGTDLSSGMGVGRADTRKQLCAKLDFLLEHIPNWHELNPAELRKAFKAKHKEMGFDYVIDLENYINRR